MILLTTFFVVITTIVSELEASCFDVPKTLSFDEIVVACESGTLDMSWSLRDNRESHFRFITDKNEVYLELLLVGNAPELFDKNFFDFLRSSHASPVKTSIKAFG